MVQPRFTSETADVESKPLTASLFGVFGRTLVDSAFARGGGRRERSRSRAVSFANRQPIQRPRAGRPAEEGSPGHGATNRKATMSPAALTGRRFGVRKALSASAGAKWRGRTASSLVPDANGSTTVAPGGQDALPEPSSSWVTNDNDGAEPAWRGHGRTERITMLLENNPYPQDIRVRQEAESLASAGHVVEVIAPRGTRQIAHESVNGVKVRRYRSLSLARQDAWAVLLEYAVAIAALNAAGVRALLRGSTVLHLHNPPDLLFPAGALFRLARRRVVFDHHDLAPELAAARYGSGLLVGGTRLAERLTFGVANHVLAANASHADIAVQRGGKQPADVTVVRNGPRRAWTRVPLRFRPGHEAAFDPKVRPAFDRVAFQRRCCGRHI